MRASAPALSVSAESEPATPNEVGTPMSSFDDIPIDPALMGPMDKQQQILYEEPSREIIQEIYQDLGVPVESVHPEPYITDYSQAPPGEPPQIYFPPQPMKRKRRSKKEKSCDFCQGDDLPETMLSCVDCGGSAHPSCMPPLKYITVEAQLSKPWRCAACKSCEICGGKENDQDLLLCDGCDRGWHGSCLDPPMDETPEGDWFCSECSQMNPHLEMNGHYMMDTPLDTREPSVASSSKSHITQTNSKMAVAPRKRGPGRPPKAIATTNEGVATPLRRTRTTSKIQSSKKGKGRAVDHSDDELVTPSAPQPKRMRFRLQSPPQPPAIPKVRIRLTQKGKGKRKEREEEEKGLFDDVLGESERDTSKTVILQSDKHRFEQSRTVAEQSLAPRPPRFSEIPEDEPVAGPSTRPLRSSKMSFSATSNSPVPSTPGGPTLAANTGRIRSIRFGAFEIKTWYDAPFPEEYANIPDGRLWICEFCLKYMKSKFGAVRHQMKCKAKHPPGDEIYRDGSVSIFEVDGRKNKIYCQNLCLLSKMYLDHKSLFYDVEPFLFYVMTEVDDGGARFVGYFSKEKRSPKDYNVSCIMTLPVRQRQGWGNLLIDFSYLLSKKEQRTGSPEKPLSALGALGYKNYWTLSLMRYLETAPENPRLEDISAATSMTIEDTYNTLVQQNMISARPATPPSVRPSPGQSIKYIKGRRGGGSVARRNLQRTLTNTSERSSVAEDNKSPTAAAGDKHHTHTPQGPFIAPKEYEITWDPEVVQSYMNNWEAKGYLKLRPEKLKWSPFLLVKSGEGGEVGVVKKTEATGATGTGETMNGLELEIGNGNGNESGNRGSDTPASLFDDDNVVPAAEMEVPNLSTHSGAVTPVVNDRTTRSSASGTPSPSRVPKQDRASPSPPKGRKKRTKALDEDEAALPSAGVVVPAGLDSEEAHQNGVAHPDPEADESGAKSRRSPRKGKKTIVCAMEDEPGTNEVEAEVEAKLEQSTEAADAIVSDLGPKSTSTRSSATSPTTSVKRLSLRGRSVKRVPSPPAEAALPVTPAKPRQLRNRAVAVASGDTGVSLGTPELQRTGSGRRLGSPRKRRRVESSPEPDGEYSVASSTTPAEVAPEDSGSEEATAATSLLSLLHSQPVVFNGGSRHASEDFDGNVKVEDGMSRHSIPSDTTLFTDTHGGGMAEKGDEQMDVDGPLLDVDESEEADGEFDYDIDDGDAEQ